MEPIAPAPNLFSTTGLPGLTIEFVLPAQSTYESDIDLAQACLAADNSAAETLHSLYHQRLLGLLINRGATNTEAGDLLADLWGECTVGRTDHEPLLCKYHGKCGLYTWLATVATHRLVDLKRRQRFQGNLPSIQDGAEVSNDFDQLPARPLEVTETALTTMMREALKSALAECPPQAYLLLQLVYIHGIMQREAARIFGWHESKVSRTLDQTMADIAAHTMRYLRATDPWLQVNWDDFMQLCQSHNDLFTLPPRH
jgi:RNA polymerase sigma factor (sigma-70 family)